jgi:protein-S-isoprenylcysteine O-methyltransferase Ste14
MLKILDVAERAFVLFLSVPFVLAFAQALPMHPYFIVIAISEMLAVVLILIRRPGHMAATPYAFTIAILGTALPLLIRPTGGVQLAPVAVTTSIMTLGLTLSIFAKLFLNRSFGIVAANRGIKRGGPYAFVRHPMYLGYIISQAGFLLAVFSVLNLACYLVAWMLQVLRIIEEERLLRADSDYRDFASSTRWRLVPRLF